MVISVLDLAGNTMIEVEQESSELRLYLSHVRLNSTWHRHWIGVVTLIDFRHKDHNLCFIYSLYPI